MDAPAVLGPLYAPATVLHEAAVAGRPGAVEVQVAVAAGHVIIREVDVRLDKARVDAGEAAAIALARAISCAVLLDDREARTHAARSGVTLTGTLGVLVGLTRAGRIDRLEPVLDRLEAVGFRMTPELRATALRAVAEE